MNSVSLKYRGIKQVYHAPSAWNEVNLKTFLLWISVMYANISEEMKLKMAIPVFYGIPMTIYKEMRESLCLQVLPTLQPLFSENRLNIWLLRRFKLFFRSYYGPADKLSNLTAHEFFNVCEPLYWKYKTKRDEQALNALCASLYRQKRNGKIDDDIREPLTDSGIANRARLFRFVSLNTKRAIAFNYEGCRNFISSHRDFKKAFADRGGRSKKRGDVTLSLAGGPLGDLNHTRQTNLYTFLMHLVNLIEQEEELKRA